VTSVLLKEMKIQFTLHVSSVENDAAAQQKATNAPYVASREQDFRAGKRKIVARPIVIQRVCWRPSRLAATFEIAQV
jgi:hypothetical protein